VAARGEGAAGERMRRIGVLLPTAADDAVIRPASWGSHLATHRSRPGSTISPPYVKPRCRFETFFETPTFSESNNFAAGRRSPFSRYKDNLTICHIDYSIQKAVFSAPIPV
jgi:hypothetical protein